MGSDIGIHRPALHELLMHRRRALAQGCADDAAAAATDAPAQRRRRELDAVDAALARLERGGYGDCLQCRRPIPLQRLLLQPAAERCAACQAVFDAALRR